MDITEGQEHSTELWLICSGPPCILKKTFFIKDVALFLNVVVSND